MRIYKDRIYTWTEQYQGISGFRRREPILCAVVGSCAKSRVSSFEPLTELDCSDGRMWRVEDGHLPGFQPVVPSGELAEAFLCYGAVSAVEAPRV